MFWSRENKPLLSTTSRLDRFPARTTSRRRSTPTSALTRRAVLVSRAPLGSARVASRVASRARRVDGDPGIARGGIASSRAPSVAVRGRAPRVGRGATRRSRAGAKKRPPPRVDRSRRVRPRTRGRVVRGVARRVRRDRARRGRARRARRGAAPALALEGSARRVVARDVSAESDESSSRRRKESDRPSRPSRLVLASLAAPPPGGGTGAPFPLAPPPAGSGPEAQTRVATSPRPVDVAKLESAARRAAKGAERELARAEATRTKAAQEKAKATEATKAALDAEQAARKAELESKKRQRSAMKRYLNDTTASAATGVLLVSVVGTVWRSSGGSILVAAAIRTAVEGRSATKTFYAVRWDDPEATPEGPDALPTTATVLERDATLTELKTAIANAEELPCGWTDVSHVAHVEPNLRFLRPLRTKEDLHALPDHGWVIWAASSQHRRRMRGGGGRKGGPPRGRRGERRSDRKNAKERRPTRATSWSRGGRRTWRTRSRRSCPCSSRGRGGGGGTRSGGRGEQTEARGTRRARRERKTALLFSETKC